MTQTYINRTEICEFAHRVQADASRSLELLRAIESTLTWLRLVTSSMEAATEFANAVNAQMEKLPSEIDEDGKLSEALEAGQSVMEEMYNIMLEKRQHAIDDHQLTDEDGVVEAYTDAIAASADLHNAINNLRWNVGEHDLDVSKGCEHPGPSFSTPEELEHYLDAL